jgi:hypothetical protein
MKMVTIPKDLMKKGDLVVIPRQDYEQLLKRQKVIPVSKLTPSERKALERGRRNIRLGEYIPLDTLVHELAPPRRKKR